MKLAKIYNPHEVENQIYKLWESSGFFNPDNLPKKGKVFSIAMPPPNATGELHIGHALFIAIQDLITRYHRMKGDKTLLLPGIDHAAIATQNVVEKELKKEGKTKYDLGREKFVQRIEKYVEDSKDTIRKQIKKMGSSCDWSRERYTLDKGLSQAVQTVFIKMYEDGLIYQGERIVNWCPRCESTLADDEVEYQEVKGKLYFIKYGPLTIATTRPETKLGDTGIAVNPDDKRYKGLIGRALAIDLAGHRIKVKVFANREVDPEFGTGAIGVTPAHSFQDSLWAKKYHLETIKVIDEKGRMTKAAGKYANLKVLEARKKIVSDLKEADLLEKIEDYLNNLSVCYRCGTAIEPLPSKQWFVAVDKPIKERSGKTLKELALEVVKNGEIKIIPERFKKIYFHWMENLQDWCISRQLWFGHRIPVWYRDKQVAEGTGHGAQSPEPEAQSPKPEEIYVGIKPPEGNDWQQDSDVLDTWFSSGLWTFSTLGWPKKTKDLETFHPTSVMETGYDILFFWVARMILMTTYVLDEIPFKTVYLHGLVRDKQGRKMSKSLGNGIDPLEMAQKYGADAVRLSLLIGTTPGNDIRLYEEKIAGYRNFVNKLWNISRFILISTKSSEPRARSPELGAQTLSDKWILSRLNRLVAEVTQDIENYRFSPAGEKIFNFTWSELADWYLEISKISPSSQTLWILYACLENVLALVHPFIPFVTEHIWKLMGNKDLLMIKKWPSKSDKKIINPKIEKEFNNLQELIIKLRNFRAEYNIPPSKIIPVLPAKKYLLVEKEKAIIEKLSRVEFVDKKSKGGVSLTSGHFELIIPLAELIDPKKEKKRTEAELNEKEKHYQSLNKRLSNKHFLQKAPKEIVAKEKEKEKELKITIKKLREKIKNL